MSAEVDTRLSREGREDWPQLSWRCPEKILEISLFRSNIGMKLEKFPGNVGFTKRHFADALAVGQKNMFLSAMT